MFGFLRLKSRNYLRLVSLSHRSKGFTKSLSKGFTKSFDPINYLEDLDKPIVKLSIPIALFSQKCALNRKQIPLCGEHHAQWPKLDKSQIDESYLRNKVEPLISASKEAGSSPS